jgi:hypothetical protein
VTKFRKITLSLAALAAASVSMLASTPASAEAFGGGFGTLTYRPETPFCYEVHYSVQEVHSGSAFNWSGTRWVSGPWAYVDAGYNNGADTKYVTFDYAIERLDLPSQCH